MDSRRHFLEKVSGIAGTLAVAPGRVLGANERVRVGLIGVGDRGVELIHQIRACSNAEVAAVSDIFAPNLERAAKLLPGAHATADFREVLSNSQIDAIVIATPPHAHADIFCAALEADKHVYVEKTLANSLADLKRMHDAVAHDSGAHIVQVGHQATSFGHMTDVRQFLSPSARVGQMTSLTMRHHRNVPFGKTPWAKPALGSANVNARNLDWAAFSAGNGRDFDADRFIHWRHYAEYSGGGVTENMSQQLAFWYKALDLKIPETAAMTGGIYVGDPAGRENPDTMNVSLTQPEQMLITWSSGFGNNQLGVAEELLGSAGTIARANQVRYIPQKINRPDGVEILGRTPQAPHAHMQNFFDAIRSGASANCPFEAGYRVNVACLMAVESYWQGRTVGWDAVREEII